MSYIYIYIYIYVYIYISFLPFFINILLEVSRSSCWHLKIDTYDRFVACTNRVSGIGQVCLNKLFLLYNHERELSIRYCTCATFSNPLAYILSENKNSAILIQQRIALLFRFLIKSHGRLVVDSSRTKR